MSQIELACKDLVFHFNKGHLADPTIPMWIVKAKGESYYVHHVDCNAPWSTKETPNNNSTKGSIKIKNCLLVIDQENNATITTLTEEDKKRLGPKSSEIAVITSSGLQLRQALGNNNIKHGNLQQFGGGCGTAWYVTTINESDLVFLTLLVPNIRKLMPNETYYERYMKKEGYQIVTPEELEEEMYDN